MFSAALITSEKSLLISKDTYEIPIPLLIRKDSFSFNYENFIRGYHVHMKLWSPLLDECLFGKKEQSNGVDKNAVAVIRLNSCGKQKMVGHLPQNILKVVSLYICLPHCYLELEVTGKRMNCEVGYGFEIPSRIRFYGPEKATQCLETRLTKIEEQLKESVNIA